MLQVEANPAAIPFISSADLIMAIAHQRQSGLKTIAVSWDHPWLYQMRVIATKRDSLVGRQRRHYDISRQGLIDHLGELYRSLRGRMAEAGLC